MKYLSVCSGIGGFELALNKYGHECIGYSEINKYAIQIYEKHFPGIKNYGDISKIITAEILEFDMLVGGFPCQPFSNAGERQGFEDARGTIFFDIARICQDKRPRYLLLENVQGLLSHDSGKTFQTILRILTDIGYRVQWQILNTKDFGIPQNRNRLFIFGSFREESRPKIFPIQLSATEMEGIYRTLTATDYKGISPNQYFTKHHRNMVIELANTNSNRKSPANLTEIMYCLDQTNSKAILDNLRLRHLTPIESERLQGFPDNWTSGISDTQRYKCIGNAVSVPVVQEIIKQIKN